MYSSLKLFTLLALSSFVIATPTESAGQALEVASSSLYERSFAALEKRAVGDPAPANQPQGRKSKAERRKARKAKKLRARKDRKAKRKAAKDKAKADKAKAKAAAAPPPPPPVPAPPPVAAAK